MVDDDVLLPYRLRTVQVGVRATVLAVGLLLVYPLLAPADEVRLGWYLAVLVGASLGVAVVSVLPWDRLFRSGYGIVAMYVWSVGDILLVTGAVAVTGGGSSPMWSVYALTTVFFAASYPVRGQFALMTFTIIAYVGASVLVGDAPAGALTVHCGVLALTAFMAGFLSQELVGEMSRHRRQRDESRRRSDLLARVAGAARSIHALDADGVLEAVVDATVGLGFEAAAIGILDGDTRTYRIVGSRGLSADWAGRNHPADEGLVGEVLRSGTTVTADRAADGRPTSEAATPIRVRGRIAAVLSASRRRADPVTAQERESMELLATIAGRALENAELFQVERHTVERLEELDRLKGDFISNVSHEMRTPLTVLQGMGDTLARRWRELDDDRRHLLIERVVANASSLNRTITTLLDFSRLEAGRLEARREDSDVSALVLDTADRMLELLDRHRLRVDVEPRLRADVDGALLERVVENLLTNAALHTPAGTTVRLSTRGDHDHIQVEVADDGPGIPPGELPHLTDRFFRGGEPNTRPTRGLGLGLALCAEILHLHGSGLEVESELGAGTSFRFRLPVNPHATSGAPGGDAPGTPTG